MKQPKTGNCEICGIQTRSLGFRCFVCKACAMFYRRTYHIREELRCMADGNCQLIGNSRSNCRYCRMKVCREVGLRMVNSCLVVQHGGYPVDDIFGNAPIKSNHESSHQTLEPQNSYPAQSSIQNNYATTSTSHYSPPSSCSSDSPPNILEPLPPQPICEFINVDLFANFAQLEKLSKIFHRFEKRQRNLVESFLSSSEVATGNSTLVDNATYLSIESGSLHLLCLSIGDVLKECCDTVNSSRWLKVIRVTVIQLSLLHKLGLAVRQFPQHGDKRISVFLGAHSDTVDLRKYLGPNYESRKNFIRPMLVVWLECMERFRDIAPTGEETFILMLALVFEEADRQHCLTSEGILLKDSIYAEFHGFLSQLRGYSTAAIRLIRLMSLQMDVKKLTESYDQMWELIRVFSPHFCEYIWHERVLEDNDNFLAEYQKLANEMSNL